MATGDRLWTFATGIYGRDGVAPACLTLQDQYGQDVLLLLFAAWAGAEGGLLLSPERTARASADAADWRNDVVEVLRGLRRRLKGAPGAPPGPDVAALREEVKRIELAAERIALTRLEQTALPWLDESDRVEGSEAAPRNLTCAFATVAGRPPDAAAAALLTTIADAAIGWSARRER